MALAFLGAVEAQANDAVRRAEQLSDLRERYREAVRAATRGAATQVVDLVFEMPILTARVVEQRLGISRPAALSDLRALGRAGLVAEERTGPRGQIRWRADGVLRALSEPD